MDGQLYQPFQASKKPLRHHRFGFFLSLTDTALSGSAWLTTPEWLNMHCSGAYHVDSSASFLQALGQDNAGNILPSKAVPDMAEHSERQHSNNESPSQEPTSRSGTDRTMHQVDIKGL